MSDALSEPLGFEITTSHLPAVSKYTAVPVTIPFNNSANRSQGNRSQGNRSQGNEASAWRSQGRRGGDGATFPAQDYRYKDSREV